MQSQRRSYSKFFKAQVIQECAQPGASIASVALSHSLNANLVSVRQPPRHPHENPGARRVGHLVGGASAPPRQIRLAWHAPRFTNGAERRTATRLDTGLAMAESWPRKRHFRPLSRTMPHPAAQLSDQPVVCRCCTRPRG
nr:transposase [Pseudomonas gingeri]